MAKGDIRPVDKGGDSVTPANPHKERREEDATDVPFLDDSAKA